MKTQDFKIRPAQEADVPVILKFIRELAEFEKLSHEVIATEEILKNSLFGPQKRSAEILIGEVDGQAVAFALFFHNFSTFLGKSGIYLEDLYVTPQLRSHGYGEALLSHIAKLAISRDCGRLEWSVLDWNEHAIRFYKKLGAVPMNEWTAYRLTGESLVKLAQK
jgi:GNAT superfamily N-acetyltransferase